MKKLAILSLAPVFAVVLTAGNTWADQISVYTAKFACGDGGFSSAAPSTAGAVTNAHYRTAINIANPSNRSLTVYKQVVLTESRDVNSVCPDVTGQTPRAPENTIEGDVLVSRGAVEWDCDQLGALFGHDFSGGGFSSRTP